ncbi:hypothetical protein CAEBREN_15799 [Caenorhabditis brenneri]|uniref:SH3 domain-containing protein n=1 Tax=Caenorhabditis brenneri TaxID=135651 RepID=G0NSU0_CAEBE|nr:hypothetical protein CAEBREN_15799 [Caenorhabditis brenneri]
MFLGKTVVFVFNSNYNQQLQHDESKLNPVVFAVYPYKAQDVDKLSFDAGEELTNKDAPGWWQRKINNRDGLGNYVKELYVLYKFEVWCSFLLSLCHQCSVIIPNFSSITYNSVNSHVNYYVRAMMFE